MGGCDDVECVFVVLDVGAVSWVFVFVAMVAVWFVLMCAVLNALPLVRRTVERVAQRVAES